MPGERPDSPAKPRRRWTAADKIRLVEQTYEPDASVGYVARRNGVADRLLRRWRRLIQQGVLTAGGMDLHCAGCGEPLRKPSRPDAKFCSSGCRQGAYRLRKSTPLWLGLIDWADIVTDGSRIMSQLS